ncbi:hypothetical protein MA20_31810 [Bradyrhizobium japonicum]|uniref:Uncharacterized protein n=1 Tax=Bradyrhizobium japonicum TaxID=375 RepID=A0A0A3XN19_BRAJP|nr:hypothetical protein MA20_31810 [Bradyrhizobium japonicum]
MALTVFAAIDAILALLTALLAIVVAQLPADVVTSPVSAGCCAHDSDDERSAKLGCEQPSTPALDSVRNQLLEEHVDGTDVVATVPASFLSCSRLSVEST